MRPTTEQRGAFMQASWALADALLPKPGETYTLHSRSTDEAYEMIVTPDGYAVHQGEGCAGETFNGPLACWHAKTRRPTGEEMNQAVTEYKPQVPQRIDFDSEQLKTITDVIAVDYEGNRAPAPFVQLFLAACRHTGLDPFLRQIYPLNIKGKWTMFVGIDGYRVISERTGLDQGMDGPQWSDDGQDWYDYPPSDGAPANYCRVGIWRKGVPRPFVAVLAMASKMNPSSDSWKKDPNGMLAKCCESLARRRAYPADMSVLPNDVQFSVDDETGAPLTRAEVPEGSFRELPEQTPAVDVQAPPAPPTPRPAPPQPDAAPTGPIPLLNAIGEQQGLGAKQAAIKVMTRLFDTAAVTKLDDGQRAEYADILAFRLAGTVHEHDESLTPSMVRVCRLCGDELDAEETPAPEQVGLPV